MRQNKVTFLLVLSGIFLMVAALVFEAGNTYTLDEIANRAGGNITAKLERCKEITANVRTDGGRYLQNNSISIYNSEKIGIYLFKADSLIFWNNSRIPVRHTKHFSKQHGVSRINHGYYLYYKEKFNDTTVVTACLIKPDYELQNNYLNNDFTGWTGVPAEIELDTIGRGSPVMLGTEKLFSVTGTEKYYYKQPIDNLSTFLFAVGFIILLVALLSFIRRGVSLQAFVGICAGVLLFRMLMLTFDQPSFFYRSILYDVRLFANADSLFNAYLGDILLNALTYLFISASLYFYLPEDRKNFYLKISLLAAMMLLLSRQINSSITSLVNNSTLNFDFLNIFNITIPALIGLSAIAVCSIALLIIVVKAVQFFKKNSYRDLLIFSAVIFLLCLLQYIFFKGSFFESFWLLLYAIPVFYFINFRNIQLGLACGLQILLISIISSVILNTYIEKNQKKDLEILSLTLSERQDPVLESEYARIPPKIIRDESLRNLINILPNTKEATGQLLQQKYFNEYFNRYNVEFALFDANCNPLLEPKMSVLFNEGFFEDQLRMSDSTSVSGLYFVTGHKQNSRYIGKIVYGDKRLYFLMEPKQFEEMGSFPDLLLDQSQQKHEKLKNFSYAVYRSRQNTSHYGNFNYPLFLPDSTTLARADEDFIHRFYRTDENTSIIISRNAKTWIYFFTFNSYLLLFFSVITYCSYLVYAFLFTLAFSASSLTRRIQTIIILLLLLAMSAIGFTSARLVINQFESENKKQLREKTDIIITELLTQFKPEVVFERSQKDVVNLRLNEFARLFNTDISLFDRDGRLFITSQPRLYKLGLASELANPKALHDLRNNLSSGVSIREKAGSLTYLSLYTPLFNNERQLIGFINLPYFARQNDLVNELSGIISALINVYVILFVIGIFGGLIFSGYITKPLRLIQQQISNISLGKKNEKIVWQSNDEIGRLIGEYNQMLVKLEESANLLAQSEREDAWREMAKQVAHEIKNPLTPMKLNLQYLQHLMKNDPAEFKEKFEKASTGIIEQINSLANIANEFSNFAKLPGTLLETINLAEVINTSLLIFESQKNITFKNRIMEGEILVKGDRDQCLRVFNNVLKNAVQALEETIDPVIEIAHEVKETSVIVSIRNNGPGIDEELRSKIFTPNFTTKTTGTGLGLAMVKNIMEGFGGSIWFDSGPGGTTFYLEFRKV
jgi:two-component system, NtrC family, nitrogen regulation sensor histidine kinase NtrY